MRRLMRMGWGTTRAALALCMLKNHAVSFTLPVYADLRYWGVLVLSGCLFKSNNRTIEHSYYASPCGGRWHDDEVQQLGASRAAGSTQGDTFLPLAAEDTGALHEEALDLLASASSALGGTAGERQAFLTYWRQVMAITTARGVAKVIKQRVPACTGAHWPVQPHHFQHVQDAVVPPQPRQHLPMRQPQTCMPCNQDQPVADPEVRVCHYPDVLDLPDCALAARDAPDLPDCALAAQGAQHLPDSPVAGGVLYMNNDGVFAGGRASG